MVAEHINALTKEWRLIGFVGGPDDRVGDIIGSAMVLGTDDWLTTRPDPTDVVIAVGRPQRRAEIASRLRPWDNLRFPNLIHPTVSMDATRVEFGCGNVITAGVALTCDIEIGDFNYLNLNATVGHDVRIGSFNVINPGTNLSGRVFIGDEVLVGTGAQLLEEVKVDDGAVIGAGAVVVKDVATGVTVVGVPAKPLPATNS